MNILIHVSIELMCVHYTYLYLSMYDISISREIQNGPKWKPADPISFALLEKASPGTLKVQ